MATTRKVCFTKNNYSEEDIELFLNEPSFSYVVFGKEIAPTTGTPHLQGYAEFPKKARFAKLARKLKSTFFPAKGNGQ